MKAKELKALVGVQSLLTSHNANPKVAKAEKKLGIRTAILHLAPGDMSGHEVCASRSPGCSEACLHYAGSPVYQQGKTKARIARTQFFFKYRALFLHRLKIEIEQHLKKAIKENLRPAVRLNGTSDLAWERLRGDDGKTIIEHFPTVQFYDYTAIINRLRRPLPANYHLTFSEKENNLSHTLEAKALGFNVATVFTGGLPNRHHGLPVIDGDEHDYRPNDPKGCIVGLNVKGAKGRADRTGFIQIEHKEDLAA